MLPIIEVPLRLHSGQEVVRLLYLLKSTGKTQPRFQNRRALEPQIDMRAYRCKAVIDWLSLEFALGRETQWQHLQRPMEEHYGGKPYVTGPNGEERYQGDRFVVHLHDPSPGIIDNIIREVDGEFSLRLPPRVRAMEISLDWYPKSGKEKERRLMVGVLQRHFLAPEWATRVRNSVPRTTYGEGDGEVYRLMGESHEYDRPPAIDKTLQMGAQRAPVTWRVMDKITDRRNPKMKTFETLTLEECRARIEVTLRGAELKSLGIETLDDLRALDFGKLRAEYFGFWLPTFEVAPTSFPWHQRGVVNFWRWMQIKRFKKAGLFAFQKMVRERMSPKRVRRINSRSYARYKSGEVSNFKRVRQPCTNFLLAYDKLNRRAEKALRRLRV